MEAAKDEERRAVGGRNGAIGGTARDGVAFFQKRADGGVARGAIERLGAVPS